MSLLGVNRGGDGTAAPGAEGRQGRKASRPGEFIKKMMEKYHLTANNLQTDLPILGRPLDSSRPIILK